MSSDLQRFQRHHPDDFLREMGEIDTGGKVSHWMWFILPQITSLGRSRMAITYGINSMEEAEAYLSHPVLGCDYVRIVAAVARQVIDRGVGLTALMGQPDDTKLVSSLGLFGAVARRSGESALQQLAGDCDNLLVEAERQGFGRCAATAAFVASSHSAPEPPAIESVRVDDCRVAAVRRTSDAHASSPSSADRLATTADRYRPAKTGRIVITKACWQRSLGRPPTWVAGAPLPLGGAIFSCQRTRTIRRRIKCGPDDW